MILMHMAWWRMTQKWEHNECDLTFSLLFFGVNCLFSYFFKTASVHFGFLLPSDRQNKLQVLWYEITFHFNSNSLWGHLKPTEICTTNQHFSYVANLLVIICKCVQIHQFQQNYLAAASFILSCVSGHMVKKIYFLLAHFWSANSWGKYLAL